MIGESFQFGTMPIFASRPANLPVNPPRPAPDGNLFFPDLPSPDVRSEAVKAKYIYPWHDGTAWKWWRYDWIEADLDEKGFDRDLRYNITALVFQDSNSYQELQGYCAEYFQKQRDEIAKAKAAKGGGS